MKRFLLTALLVLSLPALAGVTERVKFKPGTSGATIKGSVIRGERDNYILGAGAGQWIKIKIYSLEDNAVFELQNPDGSYEPMPGDGQDTKFYQGPLPSNGDYKIVVGGTRGNATYTLMVEIR
jgi:hypothetical protein